MREKILIVTSKDEPNVPDVSSFLSPDKIFRLNTDSMDQYRFVFSLENGDVRLEISSKETSISFDDVKSVWYRRPPKVRLKTEELDRKGKDFAESEWQRFIKSLWNNFDYSREETLWVNHPFAASKIEHNKQLQIQTARKVGLTVPDTIVTNKVEEANRFVERCGGSSAMKAFSSFSENEDGIPIGVYTNIINRETLDSFGEDLRFSPVILQNYVPKRFELRVTVIGQQVLACAIHSQESERTMCDWRHYDFKNVRHEKYELPEEVKKKLLSCMKIWGLQFGAIDLILTPDDDHVFLEINPSGHWGWIESLTGLPISESIAKLLNNESTLAL